MPEHLGVISRIQQYCLDVRPHFQWLVPCMQLHVHAFTACLCVDTSVPAENHKQVGRSGYLPVLGRPFIVSVAGIYILHTRHALDSQRACHAQVEPVQRALQCPAAVPELGVDLSLTSGDC